MKKRTVATLGRAEQVDGSLDAVINGLLKITGREPMGAKPPAPTVSFESARALGDVWALTELWRSLGFSELRRVFRRTRHTTDVEALIRLMLLNRPAGMFYEQRIAYNLPPETHTITVSPSPIML